MINLNKHFGIKKDLVSKNYDFNNIFKKGNTDYTFTGTKIHKCKCNGGTYEMKGMKYCNQCGGYKR